MLNDGDKIEAVSKFLLQSPPGEINDVLNDVRAIVRNDELLRTGILPALEQYNVEQLITVKVPDADHQVIISEAGRLEQGTQRFVDPKSHTSFELDHIQLQTSDPQPVYTNEDHEAFRSALEVAAEKYVADHFEEGVVTVFPPKVPGTEGETLEEIFIIQIVSNKYNPSNFWSGRWRSEYYVDVQGGEVHGRVLINVHYYENGNVQLSTQHNPTFPFPPSGLSPDSAASYSHITTKILAQVEALEDFYQRELNDAYTEMGEKTFKSLRRALPLTRQKLDWDKVTGYKLGAELAAGKGGFGAGNLA
ncbi:F-actin-capping protein subunit alpha [Cantharellus anzutake]|uniref:F-actin-capping protein subunit alpha n=1 Tax=Cantharellus anzutake TaxID=1750568 RepID=UPI0019084397|nr:F-actin-capping protein subunit alpha [Cantharellus anzutake]KAF8340339.1 F-actin-capping protein subunit alpha [Cantharellus anzutake]